MEENKRIVVTGATGMIGISLVKYLLQQNCKVLAIVRDKKRANDIFLSHPNLEIIEYDLENLEKIELKEKYDVFYHIAWDGTRGEDRNNIDRQLKNIEYTIKALKIAKKLGCNTFIGTGSQAEYGRVEGKITPDTIAKPETAYGVAKLCAGQMSRILANQLEIKHIWTRILSVYGPFDSENTMIMSSIKEMLKHNSPEYTKAEQLWDYLYVEDAAKALYLIGQKGKNDSIYCIGSGKSLPLNMYINEIRNQIDPNIELMLGVKPYSANQVMNLCADISNLSKDTGFVPEIDFKKGIEKTIKWYKENK